MAFLSQCSGVKESLGLTRDVPDEFEVTSYETLKVPQDAKIYAPGGKKQTLKPVSLGQIILGKPSTNALMPSIGEKELLDLLGAQPYKDIRLLVDQEVDTPLSTTQELQQKAKSIIMFWKKDKKKAGKVIHAVDEKKRLEKNDLSA